MQKIIADQHEVLIYRNGVTSWTFFIPQNTDCVPIYEVVLEELGRARLFYNLNFRMNIEGLFFEDDNDNQKAINWMRREKCFEFWSTYDGGTTDVRANSGEMVSIRALFWLTCLTDGFYLHNMSDIWVPVANEFEMYGVEQTEESCKSYINKYAAKNSSRFEECLKSIQQRISFVEINDAYDIHKQEGFRMYNHQRSLEKHFSGTDLQDVSCFSWESRKQTDC